MSPTLLDRNDRLRGALLAGAINAALGYAILTGLGVAVVPSAEDALKLFALSDELPPPPPIVPPPPEPSRSETRKPKDPEGAAAPPAKRDTPTQIQAPKTQLPVPSPIVAAPVPGQGNAPRAGAAPIDGPGTGRGGIGNGLGSGRAGSGTGGGGSGGYARGAMQIAGGIGDDDYPTAALIARQQGMVRFAFTVLPDGRAANCRILRSSGSRALDSTTCRLALQRFRFRPAIDTSGRAIASEADGEQDWRLGADRVIDEPAD